MVNLNFGKYDSALCCCMPLRKGLMVMAVIEIILNFFALQWMVMNMTIVIFFKKDIFITQAIMTKWGQTEVAHNTIDTAGLYINSVMSLGFMSLGFLLFWAAKTNNRTAHILWICCTETLLILGFCTFLSECIIDGFNKWRAVDLCLVSWKMYVWFGVYGNIALLKPATNPEEGGGTKSKTNLNQPSQASVARQDSEAPGEGENGIQQV